MANRLVSTREKEWNALLSQAKSMAPETSIRDTIVSDIYRTSKQLCNGVIQYTDKEKRKKQNLDQVLTSPIWGFPIMFALLAIVIWLTIVGANVPSDMLGQFFGWLEGYITIGFTAVNAPDWLYGVLVLGLYRGITWVVSVMLPPMAIFFPIFALLENWGYLPRVAFNMDRLFKSSGGHGKQALTMAMGFGCNAAAIISTRIIESPRERMLAILTNNFVPCNGRWPTLILLASLFMTVGFASSMHTLVTAGVVMGMVLIGIIVTLTVSWVLSKTALKGIPTHYTLELPPYRKPQILRTIVQSARDKAWFVLKRAVKVAAPAGVITWILANITVSGASVLEHIAAFLDPFAHALGMDGFILMAFILGLPANEIVVPILLMGYLATGAMTEVDNLNDIKQIFLDHGWTWLTALNMMLFSLLHYPCGTTIYTIYKETNSVKWTLMSALIPTGIAIVVTYLVAQIVYSLGLV
ncbi:nucleoside recognition domain-containing protein [Brevibacillus sp. SYSU BS000544]|uniref:nucleoside recognition domain-containing protein n=1 Tax=Brevibacillus sp. SYSU BS000544 TaxID=3416443 RepID=UPI003CE510EA